MSNIDVEHSGNRRSHGSPAFPSCSAFRYSLSELVPTLSDDVEGLKFIKKIGFLHDIKLISDLRHNDMDKFSKKSTHVCKGCRSRITYTA
jgi:hypothetical protein